MVASNKEADGKINLLDKKVKGQRFRELVVSGSPSDLVSQARHPRSFEENLLRLASVRGRHGNEPIICHHRNVVSSYIGVIVGILRTSSGNKITKRMGFTRRIGTLIATLGLSLFTIAGAANPFSSNVVALTPENWREVVLDSPHAVMINICRIG